MEHLNKISIALIALYFSSLSGNAQNLNVQMQQQINVMPINVGGPNMSGVININVNNNNDNNVVNFTVIDNGTLSNVPKISHVNPVLSNGTISNVNKPASPKIVTGNVIIPSVTTTNSNATKPVVKNVVSQSVVSRSATPVNRSVPQRTAPVQQTVSRSVLPAPKPVAQRSNPNVQTAPVANPRYTPAPKPVAVKPVQPLEPETSPISSIVELPIQNNSYIQTDNRLPEPQNINVVVEATEIKPEVQRENTIEMPEFSAHVPSMSTVKEKVEKEEAAKMEIIKPSKDREISMPSVSINLKKATSKRTKIVSPKKGNKNFYTQKYATKVSFRVRFSQSKKAIKSIIKKGTSKKKIKIAPKVCFTF